MIKEFCAITGCTEDNIIPNFANLEQRVLHFAALKSKKSVSTLASLYRHCHNTKTTALVKTTVCFALHYIIVHADATTAYVMQILDAMINQKNKGKDGSGKDGSGKMGYFW